jgi:hypothetical protein
MRLASRTARWLRIIAERQGVTISAVIRDLRTAPNLAREVVRVLDQIARDEAIELLNSKPIGKLPPDADMLLRHHYTTIAAARDEKKAKEQAAAWAEHTALMGG